ncbi:elongation factor EF-2 [Arabidopsis thaliana]|uniref:Elongation factor-like 1 n=1 Tax=Arabidopsis thaliana TaxID=3702 RepID=Q9LS91_ARATH|nr:elongation factor EF-2 [Arabidopsis thaliana]
MDESEGRKVRNICILAHVDHGKTTLADHLIASSGGGVLHPRLAGKLRFMDYLDEEQRRAITMKSSSISLKYKDYSLNLIDSPGHMDFCSEVSTAARLSDGALVLVDAVEGVHIQTHAVLRQAWIEKLTPCLVLNKIDRLIFELRLSPMEAYTRLIRIVHEVNGIVSAYKSEKYLSDVDSILASPSGELSAESLELLEDDEEVTFQPQKGKKNLSAGSKAKPMFVQFVLEPLWQVYEAALDPGGDKAVLEKVIKSFNLSIPPRELQNKDPKNVLQSVMSRWLPLSDAVLSMAVKHLPDPIAAQAYRIPRLVPERKIIGGDDVDSSVLAEAELVRKSIEACDSSSDSPCVVFVSKMFAIPMKMIPQDGNHRERMNGLNDDDSKSESDECFLAFARIFSGVLRAGQRVFVITALYDPLKGESSHKYIQEAELHSLYLMMGQGLTPVTEVKAGNVVAIRGLGPYISKSATLSSTRNCWPLASMEFQVSPTLRVAIEPSDPADMSALMKGLRLLNRADPFVEITVSARGEHVLAAAGEVHLERCVKDLKERFAKVNLEVSPPLVSYRETIEGDGSNLLESLRSLSLNSSDYIEKRTPNGRCIIRVHVMKLPHALTKLLDENTELLGDIIGGKGSHSVKILESQKPSLGENVDPIEELKKQLVEAGVSSSSETEKDREKCKTEWSKLLKRIWALGPREKGPNILFAPDGKRIAEDGSMLVRGSPHVSQRLGFTEDSTETPAEVSETALYSEALTLESSIVSGFQLATASGPLCDEPMWGLAFTIESHLAPAEDVETDKPENFGIFTGQVMTAVKDACRAAVLQTNPRIVEAMYFCELNTAPEYLGPMYAVLSRRRARILKEEMQEGSSLFTVHAYVPVSESFGFADELRKGTSGGASALMVLSHWEMLEEDPFFVPKTEEEIEEFGDGASVLPNTARKLINAVRRRKGLHVEEKVVQYATKQRTLARKV